MLEGGTRLLDKKTFDKIKIIMEGERQNKRWNQIISKITEKELYVYNLNQTSMIMRTG